MEINFKRSEVCELIKKYYQEKEGADVTVRISASREPVGIYETITCVTRVVVTKKTTILGITSEVKENLTEEEVTGIFNELLKDTEYEITSLSYDAGLHQETVGYYMSEHTEYRAYFNGITLYVKTRDENKKLKRS